MKIDIYASGSDGNCYRLSDGGTAILLECGIPKCRILECLNYDISGISGVLLTHNHMDHAKSVKDMAKLGLDIYSSEGTFRELKLAGHRYRVIKSQQPFTIGTLDIFPFDTQHDVSEPLGFVVTSRVTKERLLFFTDTFYVKYRFPNVDIIMGEVNYSEKTIAEDLDRSRRDRLFESHMSLEHFKQMLKCNDMSRLKKIYLLHLSDDNSNERYFKTEIQKLTGAEVYVC